MGWIVIFHHIEYWLWCMGYITSINNLPATIANVCLIITSALYFITILSLDVIIAIWMMDNRANIAKHMQLIRARMPLIYTPAGRYMKKKEKTKESRLVICKLWNMKTFQFQKMNVINLTWDAKAQMVSAYFPIVVQLFAHLPRSKIATIRIISIVAVVLIVTPHRHKGCETCQCQTNESERSYACRIQSWFRLRHIFIGIIAGRWAESNLLRRLRSYLT